MSDLYLYFSGTGNTKYVVERFANLLSEHPVVHSIEHNDIDYRTLIDSHKHITFAYPIYESMMPHIMIEFIDQHKTLLHDKSITIIVTQMLFSGDGAALLWRRIKRQNNTLRHTIHINMPNNLTDVHLFRPKTVENRGKEIKKATDTINKIVERIKSGETIRMGKKWYSWFLGFFVQRAYALPLYHRMRHKLKINHDRCTRCNMCVPLCPTENLEMKDNKIITHDQCTLCYRCINSCPTQALSLFMRHGPKTQYIRDTYN